MGTRGPVPKRSDQRRRANKPATPVSTAPAAERVELPTTDEGWHPIAKRWFESLGASGQARYYEPSDWAIACLMAESISRDLNPQFVGVTAGDNSEPIYETIPLKGASLAAYLKAFGELLMTEGARRRVGEELQRSNVVDADEDRASASVVSYLAAVKS